MESRTRVSLRSVSQRRTATRIGYVGLVDAAPFLVAQEYGIFESKGLNVILSREVGWATIREKVLFGELEAAHALSTLPFVASLGLETPTVPCVSGMVLSRGGNAIVLSGELRQRGVKSKETLKLDVDNRKAFRKYKLATVYNCSPHNFHLREWLESADINPDADVELVTLPPAQMCRNLAAGTIDGFCAGEPWASRAISDNIGWSPVNSQDLSPGHPEKVLMVRQDFAENNQEESSAMIAALVEACAVCEDVSQREKIAEILSDKKKINCSPELLEHCLSPKFDYGFGRVSHQPTFLQFFSGESNRPKPSDTDWVLQRMEASCGLKADAAKLEVARQVFRPDLYDAAVGGVGSLSS
ncbi:ABC transporter substrate-binding protein [Pelagicoccus albus]|uniref:ABC transporter substrate-binding protein n=1 Tax=Pelagicoccus albus TaxID=415222 RepID=A0A7X1E6D0_9BACT|nr:ABC transporter substrate-binding protein [Pelagicoccus albus]MBC2604565.1 ABC transporter substrate-binding protein [Pelagicoccus albus]